MAKWSGHPAPVCVRVRLNALFEEEQTSPTKRLDKTQNQKKKQHEK